VGNHGDNKRKWGGKPTSTLKALVRELQGKTISQMRVLPGKLLLQFPVVSSPDTEGQILLLILGEEFLIHIYKK